MPKPHFSSFVSESEIDETCIFPCNTKENGANKSMYNEVKSSKKDPIKRDMALYKKVDRLTEEVKNIKEIFLPYSKNIAEGIKEIREEQGDLEDRISKLELFTKSTVDEIIQYYFFIFQNISDDPDIIKDKFLNKYGKENIVSMLEQMDNIIVKQEDSKDIHKKVQHIIKSLEE